MAFERIAEQKIRQALADGTFDVVADGRPIDLAEYFSSPEELRMAFGLLKSAGCVPEEVELLKEVDRLRQAVAGAPDDRHRQPLQRALADAELRLNLTLERARRL